MTEGETPLVPQMTKPGSPIRLFFVIADGFPTFRPDVAALFGKYLPRFGVASDLVAHSTGKNWQKETASWTDGKVFAPTWHAGRLRRGLAAAAFVPWRILRSPRNAYSAIQVRDSVFWALFGLVKARASRLPFFYWMSFPRDELLLRLARTNGFSLGFARYLEFAIRGRLGAWLLRRIVLPASDHVFVQSEKMRADLSSRGISPDKMTAIPMCIDPERFDAVDFTSLPDPILKNRRVVAYLGACGTIRRIDFLIDVADDLRKSFPDILLLLIGDADEDVERRELRRTISEKGLDDHVLVTGWLEPEQALAYLARAEVALALMPPDPLLDSTSPTKLVEYFALGKPVVANEHPDQSAAMKESGAGLCVPFEQHAFVNAVQKMLNDHELARSFGQAGRRYVQLKRNYLHMAESLAGVYRRLLP